MNSAELITLKEINGLGIKSLHKLLNEFNGSFNNIICSDLDTLKKCIQN